MKSLVSDIKDFSVTKSDSSSNTSDVAPIFVSAIVHPESKLASMSSAEIKW